MTKIWICFLVTGVLAGFTCPAHGKPEPIREIMQTVTEISAVLENHGMEIDPVIAGKAVEEAILKSVDQSAKIVTAEEAEIIKKQKRGFFYGPGMNVAVQNGQYKVTEIIKDGPADMAGIAAGDIITEINGKSPDKEPVLLAGNKGDIIKLGIVGDDSGTELKTVEVVFGLVAKPVISVNESWPHDLCYMKIEGIYPGAGQKMLEAFEAWSGGAFFGVILDLRGADGSDFNSVAEIAGMFSEKGRALFRIVNGHGVAVREYVTGEKKNNNMLFMILINKDTRFAAEVMAGVLKAFEGVMLIGSPTSGDDKIRDFIPYNEQVLYIAMNRIELASGYDYKNKGILPDIPVEHTAVSAQVADIEEDQLLFRDRKRTDPGLVEKIGDDVVLQRAADILLGLKALNIGVREQ